jgi:hypothetical protein
MDFEAYQKVYQIDENQMFFNTVNTVKNNLNINLINDVYNNLSDKEKEYVQSTSKNYSR